MSFAAWSILCLCCERCTHTHTHQHVNANNGVRCVKHITLAMRATSARQYNSERALCLWRGSHSLCAAMNKCVETFAAWSARASRCERYMEHRDADACCVEHTLFVLQAMHAHQYIRTSNDVHCVKPTFFGPQAKNARQCTYSNTLRLWRGAR